MFERVRQKLKRKKKEEGKRILDEISVKSHF